MKTLFSIVIAIAMILSVVFLSEAISSNNPLSVSAQSMQSTVTMKHRKRGKVRRAYGRTKYRTKWSAHKAKRGTKWTYHKTKRGTRWTTHKTKIKTKHIFHKTKRAVY